MHSKEIYNKLTNMESIVRPKTPSLNPASCVMQNKHCTYACRSHFHPAWDTIGLEVHTNQWVVVESQAEVVHRTGYEEESHWLYVGGTGLGDFWYGCYEPLYAPQFQSGILDPVRTRGYPFTYHCIFRVWCWVSLDTDAVWVELFEYFLLVKSFFLLHIWQGLGDVNFKRGSLSPWQEVGVNPIFQWHRVCGGLCMCEGKELSVHACL